MSSIFYFYHPYVSTSQKSSKIMKRKYIFFFFSNSYEKVCAMLLFNALHRVEPRVRTRVSFPCNPGSTETLSLVKQSRWSPKMLSIRTRVITPSLRVESSPTSAPTFPLSHGSKPSHHQWHQDSHALLSPLSNLTSLFSL